MFLLLLWQLNYVDYKVENNGLFRTRAWSDFLSGSKFVLYFFPFPFDKLDLTLKQQHQFADAFVPNSRADVLSLFYGFSNIVLHSSRTKNEKKN